MPDNFSDKDFNAETKSDNDIFESDTIKNTDSEDLTITDTKVTQLWENTISGEYDFSMTIKKDGQEVKNHNSIEVKPHSVSAAGKEVSPVPDYELTELLGEGGMGVVYTARQTSIDREIALKMIKNEVSLRKENKDKFLSEAAVTGELAHPNIVPIYDLGSNADGQLFYAMKKVEGTPWDEVIKDKPQNENIDILMRVADAVAFAHSKGVIHRDLKPENTMLGGFGEVLVMDWGLAVSITDNGKAERLTDKSSFGGTPAYMAPEMVSCKADLIGYHSDVYLLGAILYEIVTGLRPHTGKTMQHCIVNISKNIIQPTDKRGELVDIALKAMATNPKDRYESVELFQQAIRNYEKHAESIGLTERASEDLQKAEKNQNYDDFAQALFGYREALELWKENKDARIGTYAAQLEYSKCAYANGDLEMAAGLLNSENSDHKVLLQEIEQAKAERIRRVRRLRLLSRVAAVLLGAVFIGSGLAGYFAWRAGVEAQRAGLTQAFALGLESSDWSDNRFAQLEITASTLARIAPEEHHSATSRLYNRYGEYLKERLRAPTLTPTIKSEVENGLKLLHSRDPELFGMVRSIYKERLRAWRPVFRISPPYNDVAKIFPGIKFY